MTLNELKVKYIGKWVKSTLHPHLRPICVQNVLIGTSGVHLKADGIVIMEHDSEMWEPKDGDYCFYNINPKQMDFRLVTVQKCPTGIFETSLGYLCDLEDLQPFIGTLPEGLRVRKKRGNEDE